jgi:hypothetical protein
MCGLLGPKNLSKMSEPELSSRLLPRNPVRTVTGCRRIFGVEPALLSIWAASASASTRSASQACELASWQGSSRAMPVDVSRTV